LLEIIENNNISKQEDLQHLLIEAGFKATQATVSRDLRELNIIKTANSGDGFRYTTSFQKDKQKNSSNKFKTFFAQSVLKIDYAGNIVLIKCFTGMANAACELFDSNSWPDVVGTLSGDDTFIVLMRSEEAAKLLFKQMQEFIKTED
jgi:transcriptional regulator of arginine metabolism